MTASDADRVIFLHNPRTGGITLRNALRRQFRGAPLYIPKTAETAARERENLAMKRRARPDADEIELTRSLEAAAGRRHEDRNRRYIEGMRAAWPDRYAELPLVQEHVWFGLHEHLPGTSTYITLIRDPVERAVSLYFHHLRAGGLRRSLDEYLRANDVLRDNGQTLRVSGGSTTGGYETTDELLETAKRNLVEHFAWVGVTERFTESIVLLRRTFGWRPLYFRHQNSAPRTTSPHLSADLVALVRERNRHDLELHRFAGELLATRLSADPGHAAEVERFARANRIMGPLTAKMIAARDRKIRLKGRVARVIARDA